MTPPTMDPPSPGLERFEDGPLAEDLSFLLARAGSLALAAGNAALRTHGLRVRSYSVLALAASDRRPSQRELAEFLRLDPSQIVALIDDLQGRGLVVRESDRRDRRANVVVATSEGRALYDAARRDALAAEAAIYGGLSVAERERLSGMLHAVAFPQP